MTSKGKSKNLDMTMSQQSVSKKQLIIGLDHATWKELVYVMKLEKAKIDPDSKTRHVHKRSRKE